MPLRNLLILLGAMSLSVVCYVKAPGNRYANLMAQGIRLVTAHSVHETTDRDLFEHAMAGMLSGLDEYSQFLPPRALRPLQEDLDQQFGGVGIVVEQNADTDEFVILSPSIDSPAQRAGIVAGDVIVGIEGKSTDGMKFHELVELIRGKPGTQVRLRIRRAGRDQPMEFTVARAVIEVPSVLGDARRPDGSWQYSLEFEPGIGYIRVNNFGERTASELRLALDSLNGRVDSLIVDLRNNAGGSLAAAVDACDMFLSRGIIVTTRGRNDRLQSRHEARGETRFPTELPLVVLVNRYSASASEIMAACLQDHGRAVVVGERTWGKGTVQSLFLLEGGRSALKLTVANYSRPSGANIHRWEDAEENGDWGVRPDDGFEVKLSDEQLVALAKRRSRRDLSLEPSESAPADLPPSDHDSDNGRDADSEVGAVVPGNADWLAWDPQLQRAVEHVRNIRGT
jgi:carboxyl-terminal processing protease